MWEQILQREKEKTVPFITYAERRGMEQGEIKGKQESIEVALELRFSDAAPALMPRVRQVNDLDRLEQLLQVAKKAPLAEIEAALAKTSG